MLAEIHWSLLSNTLHSLKDKLFSSVGIVPEMSVKPRFSSTVNKICNVIVRIDSC